jgi:putative phosphoesterase
MTRLWARTARVGLVADSHVGEYLQAMPAWVFDALADCDLILHAGDLSVLGVLEDLAAIAPVRAVRGDHDRAADLLPQSLVVTVHGWRIGLIHGSWSPTWDALTVVRTVLAGDRGWERRLDVELRNRLGAVDAIVYGHWHIPRIADYGPTLMICPGAVCPGGALAEGDPLPRSLHAPIDVAVRRNRRRMHAAQYRPAIAVLEVGSSGLRPRHVSGPDPVPSLGRSVWST